MALGDPGDQPHHIPGNPSPGMLGGDNRMDLGLNHIPGNLSPGEVMPHNYGDPGGDPHPCSCAPTAEEVRSMFSGSS